MKIPKIISKNGRKYEYVKVYPNYLSYKDMITGTRVSFQPYDLGLVKEIIPKPKLANDSKRKW